MKIHRLLSLFLAAFVLTGSLTACGAKSSSSNEIAYMETAAAAMDSMEMKSEPANGAKPGSVQMPAEAPEAGLTSENTLQPVSTNRKLIRTVNLLVETTDFDTLLTSVSDTVSALGGYLQSSKISGTSIADSANRQRYAYLTARVTPIS